MMTEPKHPDELTLLRLSELELAGERAEHTRRHLIECMRCRSSYEALKAETELLRAALKEQEEVLPESIRPRSDLSWIVVAAIALGTLGVSTFWTRYVEPMVQGMDSVGVDGTSIFTAIVIRGALWRGWSGMAMTLIQGVSHPRDRRDDDSHPALGVAAVPRLDHLARIRNRGRTRSRHFGHGGWCGRSARRGHLHSVGQRGGGQ